MNTDTGKKEAGLPIVRLDDICTGCNASLDHCVCDKLTRPTFTPEQIDIVRRWLDGGRIISLETGELTEANRALNNLICELNGVEDGLNAFAQREKEKSK